MVGILLMIVLVATAIMHSVDRNAYGNELWQINLQSQIEGMQQTLEHAGDLPEVAIKNLENSIKISQYRIDHDLNPNEKTLWSWVQNLSGVGFVLTILTIIVAADMVAAEFVWGTIKMLLIRPASRTKILFSKYVSTLLFSLFLLLFLFVTSFIIGGILEGFGGIGQPDLYVGSDGAVHERTMLVKVMQTYGFLMVQLIIYVTLAFMISSAFRSASMAIAFSLGLMLLGSSLVQLLSHYSWAKYILFANTDLQVYFEGMPFQEGMTLGFSVAVLVGYFLLFHLISLLMFTKRDVAT